VGEAVINLAFAMLCKAKLIIYLGKIRPILEELEDDFVLTREAIGRRKPSRLRDFKRLCTPRATAMANAKPNLA
jgi:hypothetical protein